MSDDLSEMVGSHVRALRQRRRMSVERLAELCAGVGAPELTVNALYALESGRRDRDGRRRRAVTVDEWGVLARALDVSPGALLSLSSSALLGLTSFGHRCDCSSRLRALADELESRR